MSMQQRPERPPPAAIERMPAKYVSLLGVLVGLAAGTVYWLAALVWPSSIAVVLSLLVSALLPAGLARLSWRASPPSWIDILVLLTKYNTLMALTAANLPFPVPANVALGLIMVCGSAAGQALRVSLPAALTQPVSHADVGLAMGIGFAPAFLLGIPGLSGLSASLCVRLGAGLIPLRRGAGAARANTVQQIAEAAFYLGALATWKYV